MKSSAGQDISSHEPTIRTFPPSTTSTPTSPAGGCVEVFGASDGLVSNVALIAGVAGGTQGPTSTAVVLAGLAGLAAGAFSMAVGVHLGRQPVEAAAHEIEKERLEILANPAGATSSPRCTSPRASRPTWPRGGPPDPP